MAETFDLVFRNATVVNHDGDRRPRHRRARRPHCRARRASARDAAGEVVDCTGLHILPGVIDTQVHFREPGAEHKEDLETGSRAAVMGGVTAVFEMPNTSPLTVTAAALADKLARARQPHALRLRLLRRRHPRQCRRGRRAGAAAGRRRHQDLHGLVDRRLCSLPTTRAFARSCRGPAAASRSMPRTSRASTSGAATAPRAIPHPIRSGATRSPRSARPSASSRIARETGARVHLLHVSTAEEIDFIRDHKDNVSVELTPQHLTLRRIATMPASARGCR